MQRPRRSTASHTYIGYQTFVSRATAAKLLLPSDGAVSHQATKDADKKVVTWAREIVEEISSIKNHLIKRDSLQVLHCTTVLNCCCELLPCLW